jgi:hypothetical protein
VSVSSSGMVPNRRYSEIGLRQSATGLGGPSVVATSPLSLGLGLISPTEAPDLPLLLVLGRPLPVGPLAWVLSH